MLITGFDFILNGCRERAARQESEILADCRAVVSVNGRTQVTMQLLCCRAPRAFRRRPAMNLNKTTLPRQEGQEQAPPRRHRLCLQLRGPVQTQHPSSAEERGLQPYPEDLVAIIQDLIQDVYRRRNKLDTQLAKFAGLEVELFAHVCKQYGEAPVCARLGDSWVFRPAPAGAARQYRR